MALRRGTIAVLIALWQPLMFVLTRPDSKKLQGILERESLSSPTYKEVALTKDAGRPGATDYYVHEIAIELGTGQATFDRAYEALRDWEHFACGWTFLYPTKPAIEAGTTLIVYANHIFVWSINSCRIIYVIDDDDGTVKRFGYGYGTLPVHSESGEERFLIEWDRKLNVCKYEIRAFSRSNNPLVSLAWPLAKAIQDQFRQQSTRALFSAVNNVV
jgi:uncharacterized protein (UPF0548 family)